MKSKTFHVFLIICLFLALLGTVKAPTANLIYTNNNFAVLISQTGSFAIQHGGTEVKFTAMSNWNGSTTNLVVTSNGGLFQFTPENSTTIKITYENLDTVKVNGTGVTSNTEIVSSGTTTITWNFTIVPLLPIMFIFGMIGLVSMFFGGLNFVDQMQKKHYYKAFITSTIAIAIGIAFVLAWLWT